MTITWKNMIIIPRSVQRLCSPTNASMLFTTASWFVFLNYILSDTQVGTQVGDIRAISKQMKSQIKTVEQKTKDGTVPIANAAPEPGMINNSFITLLQGQLFMYSAVATNSTLEGGYDMIYITGWEQHVFKEANYSCCIAYDDNFSNIKMVEMHEKRHWNYVGHAGLEAKQFLCKNKFYHKGRIPVAVTLTVNEMCPQSTHVYRTIDLARRQQLHSFGVCAKLVFGDLRPSLMIEWFEYQRLMQVDKVIIHTHNLNAEAMQVLEYYKSLGIAEHYPFELPNTAKYHRQVGVKNFQSWNDEQIPLFDCQIRLSGYTYIGTYDVDEFIYPKREADFIDMMIYLRKRYTNAAGFTFKTEFYATNWGEVKTSRGNYTTSVGKYLKRTDPIKDRVKSVTIVDRIQIGRTSTHGYWTIKGYKKNTVLPEIATLKHYRSCRKQWIRFGDNLCQNKFAHRVDTAILPIADIIEDSCHRVKHKLKTVPLM